MIERVARRLFLLAPARYLNGGPRSYHVGWDLLRDRDRENYRQAAIRLIEEMRIPTEEMARAGSSGHGSSIMLWQAMIQAALSDGNARI